MVKTVQERGKSFEDDVRLELAFLQEHHRAMWHRFYDTHSAGGYLPPQPGDFLAMKSGHAVLIECKISETEPTLTRKYLTSSVKDDQVSAMRVWIRAGATAIYVFKSELSQSLEIWPGDYLAEIKYQRAVKPDPAYLVYQIPYSKRDMRDCLLSILEKKVWLK